MPTIDDALPTKHILELYVRSYNNDPLILNATSPYSTFTSGDEVDPQGIAPAIDSEIDMTKETFRVVRVRHLVIPLATQTNHTVQVLLERVPVSAYKR